MSGKRVPVIDEIGDAIHVFNGLLASNEINTAARISIEAALLRLRSALAQVEGMEQDLGLYKLIIEQKKEALANAEAVIEERNQHIAALEGAIKASCEQMDRVMQFLSAEERAIRRQEYPCDHNRYNFHAGNLSDGIAAAEKVLHG